MKKITLLAALLVLVLMAGCAAGSGKAPVREPQARETPERRILRGLEVELRKFFKEACPQAAVTNEGDRIIAEFKVKRQPLNETDITEGILSPRSESVGIIPERAGFRLQVRIVEKPEKRNSITSVSSGFNDWVGYKYVTPIVWTKILSFYVILDFGRDIDKELIKKIEQAIEAYTKERQ